jgi:hypothetical protein
VAEEQDDVAVAPRYFGEPDTSSLRYDTDLVRTKSGTDVLVHGCARAPDERPAGCVESGWTVGPLSKQVRVFGDWVWRKTWSGISPSEPRPFVSLPIRYERAWGGPLGVGGARDAANPIGVGADPSPGKPVPNIEHPGKPIHSPRHRDPPASFGPVPGHWQPRARLAGTYDSAWQEQRKPLVPNDFHDSYFRCAPADQQLDDFLEGGEEVVLRNLTPEGTMRFRLPRITLAFRTSIAGGSEQHRGQLHTALPCHHTLYTLAQTIVYEKERVPLGNNRSPGTRTDRELPR